MRLLPIAAVFAVLAALAACGAGATTCVNGVSAACSCTDGRTGAQVCTSGSFGSCVCNGAGGGSGGGGGGGGGSGGGSAAVCGPSTCSGCCDSTGSCFPGTTSTACGKQGASCVNCGAVSKVCTANQSCGAPSGAKRIFITATKYNGNLGGLTGADAKCLTAAQAASLGGAWKAWLSDATTDAIDRITDVGPWVQVGSADIVFNNKANLSTIPLKGIALTEQGTNIGSGTQQYAWTGSDNGGTRFNSQCASAGSWSSTSSADFGRVGTADSTSLWTANGSLACNTLNHLYCVEQ